MKNKKFLLLILASLMMLSLACGLLGDDEEAPVVAEPASADPVEDVVEVPTDVPPTEVPPTESPPTLVPPTEAPPTPEPTPVPSWRMSAPDGAVLIVQDTDNDPDWEDIAAMHASNLAIPAPFYYELYLLPSGIKFTDVETHYSAEMTARKYRPARNEQGNSQIYLLTYLHTVDKTSKNAILFYGELSNRKPMALVIYSNPIE